MGGCRRRRSLPATTIIMIAGSLLSRTVTQQAVASAGSAMSNGSDYLPGGSRRELYHVDVTEAGQPCLESPLWNREVNPLNYEYGCRDIEAMLKGPKTLLDSGRVRDVFFVEYEDQTVVVKTLRRADDLRGKKQCLKRHKREVLALDALTGHPNVVGMLGLCGTTIVTEYYPKNFLEAVWLSGEQPPILQVVSMALDAAKGLQALHEIAGSIHIDLKPQQLLMDDSGRVLLNDFNSAHIMSINPTDGTYCPSKATDRKRLTPWPSPENYAGETLTETSDIYSLGMIFFTLVSGNVPYDADEERLEVAFLSGTRPDIDTSWHRGFVKVIQAMWDEDPKKRPYARHVVKRLQRIQEKLIGSPIVS